MKNLATFITISLTGACFVYAVPVVRFSRISTSFPKAGEKYLGVGIYNTAQPKEPSLLNPGVETGRAIFGEALQAPKIAWYHASPQRSQAKKLDVESLKLSYFAKELSQATQ